MGLLLKMSYVFNVNDNIQVICNLDSTARKVALYTVNGPQLHSESIKIIDKEFSVLCLSILFLFLSVYVYLLEVLNCRVSINYGNFK